MRLAVVALLFATLLPLQLFAASAEEDSKVLVTCPALYVSDIQSLRILESTKGIQEPYFVELALNDGSLVLRELLDTRLAREGTYSFVHGPHVYSLFFEPIMKRWYLRSRLGAAVAGIYVNCH